MRNICIILLHFTLRSVTSIEALFTDLLFCDKKLTGTVLEINARIGNQWKGCNNYQTAKNAHLNVCVELISRVTKYVA